MKDNIRINSFESLRNDLFEKLRRKGWVMTIFDGAINGDLVANHITVIGSTPVFRTAVCYSQEAVASQFGDFQSSCEKIMERFRDLRKDDVLVVLTSNRKAGYQVGFSFPDNTEDVIIPFTIPYKIREKSNPSETNRFVSETVLENLWLLLNPDLHPNGVIERNLVADTFNKDQEVIIEAEELTSIIKILGYEIATAESCTGGRVANAITSIDGSSRFLSQAHVLYHDREKIEFGIQAKTLEKGKVYSEEAAGEAVEVLYRKSGAELCISVFGLMETPDTREYYNKTEPGTIFVGISIKGKVITMKLKLDLNRENLNRDLLKNETVIEIFKFLRLQLAGEVDRLKQ